MSADQIKPRTVLKLHGLKLVDTIISTDSFANIYVRNQDAPDSSIKVLVAPDDDVNALVPRLSTITDIAIEFPSFTDGRGYSHAASLRQRLNYKGRLRAVGDVLVDQVAYMARVGFDEIELREDQSLEAAQRALKAFSAPYQSAQDHAAPVWLRYAGASV
jgi:uncharacterized protein (DUF934 family)